MAEVEILSTGDDTPDDDVLELGDAPETVVSADGDDKVEPIDAGLPETFDEGETEETPLIKLLREQLKDRNRQLAQIARAPAQIQRTKKPDLYDDCEGDPDKYENALFAWKDNEAKADAQARASTSTQEGAVAKWQGQLSAYKEAAAKLGPTFQESENAVVEALTDAQQATIVKATKNPAAFIKALGKSPNRLAQLSLITDLVELAGEAARIEGARTVPRKEPANIDTPLRGSARLSTQSGDAKEDQLIAQAAKTGDATPLRNYRRDKKAAAAA